MPIKNEAISYLSDAQQEIRRIKIVSRVKVDIITNESDNNNNSDNDKASNDKKSVKKESTQGNNCAIITGKKEDAEIAKGKLLKLFDELATTTEVELTIPHNLHIQLGPKTKPHRQLVDDFQNKIYIIFPQNNNGKNECHH